MCWELVRYRENQVFQSIGLGQKSTERNIVQAKLHTMRGELMFRGLCYVRVKSFCCGYQGELMNYVIMFVKLEVLG